jgi:hypothetical protein
MTNMKRLLTILGLFLTLSMSGQLLPGIVASQTTSATSAGSGVKPYFLSHDGKAIGWWISAYEASVTKDGNNHVTAWADTLGVNNLATYGGTPHWSSTGILFDGVDDMLKSANIAVYQPVIVYICFKQVTWTSGDFIFDGYSADGAAFHQRTSSPNLALYAGAVSADNSAMTLNTWGYAIMCSNGASSYLIVNGVTNGTENFGANNMNGITLGSSSGGASFGNIEIKEVIKRYDNLDSQAQRDSVVAYFTKRYGL